MSDFIGEAFVAIRPDAATFQQEAESQVNQAVAQIHPQIQITGEGAAAGQAQQQILQRAKQAQDQVAAQVLAGVQETSSRAADEAAQNFEARFRALDLKSMSAALGGDALVAEQAQLEKSILQAQQLGQEARLAAAANIGGLRNELLLSAEAFAQAEAKLQAQLNESVRTGRPPGAAAEGGGVLARIESLSKGRESGLGGLLASGARLGAIGFAATAAFQAVGELQKSLRVTGDEAFTTAGKFRNAGAEMLGGNFIGAIKALAAEKPVQVVGQLADKLAEGKAKADPFVVTLEKLDALYQKSPDELSKYLAVLVGFGKISIDTALKMQEIVKQNDAMARSAKIAAQAQGEVADQIARSGSEAARFGERGSEFGRGPAGVAAERAASIAAGGPTALPGTGGREVGNQIRASITQRVADDRERLKLEVDNARTIQAQARQTFENERHTERAAGAWRDYVVATTNVTIAVRAAQTATEAAAQAAQDLGNQVRASNAAAIADPRAQAQATLANARILEHQAKQAFDAAEKGTKEANQAWAAFRFAVNERIGIENDIAAQNRAAAEAAKQETQATQQGKLANAEAEAARIGSRAAQIKAITATRDYFRDLAASLTGSAREAARADAIAAQARLDAVKKGADTGGIREAQLANQLALAELQKLDTRPVLRAQVAYYRGQMLIAEAGTSEAEAAKARWIQSRQALQTANETLADLKRENARARAALTESEEDDEKLLRAEIRRLEKKVAATKNMGLVHQQAISKLLAAEKELQGMVDEIKPTTTVFDLLTKSTAAFAAHAGNIINAGNRFSSDTFTSGIRGEIGNTPNAAGRARLQLDDSKITTSLDRNTAATDRLTIAISGTEPRGHPPAEGKTTVTTGGSDAWSPPSWVARAARGGIS